VVHLKLIEIPVKEYNSLPSKTEGCIVYVLLKACSAPPNHCVQYITRVVIHIWFSVSEIANDNVKTIITTP
jgi:hypothetical protein